MKYFLHKLADARIRHTIYLLCGLLCLLMVIYIGVHEQEDIYVQDLNGYEPFPADTYTRTEDPDAPLGFREEYEWELSSPEDDNTCFIFYSIHHYVDVYVNGEPVLTLRDNDSYRITHGISGKWLYVPLHIPGGESLRIRMVSEPIYRNVTHRQPEVYLGDPVALFRAVRTEDTGNLAISLLSITFGLGAFFFWLGMRVFRKQNIPFMRYLGFLLLLLSLCRLSGMRSSSIIFSIGSTIFGYISNFSLLMAWLTFLFFIDDRYSDYHSKWFQIVKLLSCIIVLAVLMLQLLGLAEIRNLLWLVHLGVIMDLIAVGIVSYRRTKVIQNPDAKYGFGFGMLLTAGVLVDLIRLYTAGISRSLFFTFLTFLIYTVFVFVRYLYELQDDATHDQLTGLRNRHHWEQIEAHLDEKELAYGLIVIDLDGMKSVNDNFGHSAGDSLLIQFSRNLQKAVQEDCEIFRVGGDEFLVFIPNTDPSQIASIVDNLKHQIDSHNSEPGNPRISYSLGTVFSGEYPGKSVSDLLNAADERMYDNKRAKRAACV